MIKRKICLFLYYAILIHLSRTDRYNIKLVRKLRSLVGKVLFDSYGGGNIEKGAYFGNGIGLSVVKCSDLGVNSMIQRPCQIGNHVIMGPDCVIFTEGHEHKRTDIVIDCQGRTHKKKVTIKDDVWLGQRVMIMPGVTIGEHCVIAAGAVVTKDMSPYLLSGGVPAKILKYRRL